MKPFFFLLFLTNCLLTFAQTGREFWFAAPEVANSHADRPINLRISTFEKAASVSISQPANSSFREIVVTIPANTTKVVDLTDQIDLIETNPPTPNAVMNTGLYLQASEEVSAYYEVDGIQNYNPKYANLPFSLIVNTDIFVLKGTNALGTLFFVPMQTKWDNHNGYAYFDIVATMDSTEVTVTVSQNVDGHTAGTFTVLLHKGQTYAVRAVDQEASHHPTGAKVTSTKPIAITYSDDSLLDDTGDGNWDLAGDQLVSQRDIGTEYIAIKGSGTNDQDGIALTATQDGTQIWTKGDTIQLDAGHSFYYKLLDSAQHFKGNFPFYAFHVSSFIYELGGALLAPLACTGAKDIAFVRSNNEQFALNLLVKSGGEGNFSISGGNLRLTIPAEAFKEVPGTNGQWKYAQFAYDTLLPNIPYRVENTTHDFHLSTMNGGDMTGFRYGYFSGFGSVNLGSDRAFCSGDSLTIDAGRGKDMYTWNTGETGSTIIVKEPGMYSVKITKDTCSFYDTVNVVRHAPITQPILGHDTAACEGTSFVLTTQTPFAGYLWQDSSKASSLKITQSGLYFVSVTDSNGCHKADSLYFTTFPLPEPILVYATKAAEFCMDSLVVLSVSGQYEAYTWFNGLQSASIIVPHTADNTYSVSVTDQHQCVGKASISVDCSPFISIPNVFTPNGDGINDYFRIKNVTYGAWQLEVYDRWGKKVFHADPYQNDWSGQGIPDGLYFYTLRSGSVSEEYKGWVEIVR